MRRSKKSRPKGKAPSPFGAVFRADTRLSAKSGLPPGSLVHVGEASEAHIRISVIQYSENRCRESDASSALDLSALQQSSDVAWVHVDGIHRLDVISAIGTEFGLHPLVVEDIANSAQRPKIEDLGDYLFLAVKLLHYNEETAELSTEHFSLIVMKNVLLTFREREGSDFDPIRERIRVGKGRLRKSGADYLAYCLIDSVVDHYFVVIEKIAEKMELLEEELVTNPTPETLQIIHKFKTDLIFLRRSVWPLREVINLMIDGGSSLITVGTNPYLRDVYDHTIHASETLDTYRDIVSGMLDIYLSSVSYKLNEIMKVLTIIATVFIPLTFMTGWYGMNFKHMPELEWPWAYYVFMAGAFCVAMTLLGFFRRRNWF
jgi:magnesium transporter